MSGVPDECELDCNGNTVLDRLDIIPFGTEFDCNGNLVPDSCDTAAGTPGACEPATELSCLDGFDNDRDGLGDCWDAGCDGTTACLGDAVSADTFDLSAGPYGYVDDAFRGTNNPAYATGGYGASQGFEGGGGLSVTVGGVDGVDITNGMSGGWQHVFNLPTAEDVEVSFRYRMDQMPDYESDEYTQVAALGSTARWSARMGNDYVVQLTGDGTGPPDPTTGWTTVVLDLGTLAAGNHTLLIGGYNNKKTTSDESALILIDDVGIRTVVPITCGDGIVSPGEDCDDGGTVDGDCCSSTCSFEASGSSCDDATVCTDVDECDGAGTCAGTPIVCDDFDACTADGCDAVTGCFFTPIPGCVPVPAASLETRIAIVLLMAALALAAITLRRSADAGE